MTSADAFVKTAVELMRFQTTKEKPEEIKRSLAYVRDFFKGTNVNFREWNRDGITTLFVSLQDGPPTILLNGHMDVVPAQDESLFDPVVGDGKIHGRGSNDMKAAVAVMMHLLRDFAMAKEKPNVGLLISTDEETGGFNGCKQVADDGFLPKFFLSGEPTGLRIGNQAKGILQLELTVKGKGAHAATPWQGDSAILKMMSIIENLKGMFPKKGEYCSSINFGMINGGEAVNKVADACSLTVDIRVVPKDDPDLILKKVASFGASVKIIAQGSCAFCPPDDPFIVKLQASIEKQGITAELLAKDAGSDARHFAEKGVPSIVFGPVGHGSHAKDEYVEVESLEKLYAVLKEFCVEAN